MPITAVSKCRKGVHRSLTYSKPSSARASKDGATVTPQIFWEKASRADCSVLYHLVRDG